MALQKKIILVSSGDPSSIAPEITIKALQSKNIHENILPIIVTDPELIYSYNNIIDNKWKVNEIKDQNITIGYLANVNSRAFNFVP